MRALRPMMRNPALTRTFSAIACAALPSSVALRWKFASLVSWSTTGSSTSSRHVVDRGRGGG